MNKLNWYINRIKTMSAPEVAYRIEQQFQKQFEKNAIIRYTAKPQNFTKILIEGFESEIPVIPSDLSEEFLAYEHFDFFGYSIDLKKEIDWHLDISSGKKFPLSFSKDIDIRSDKYGSAKVVWEINRLQFLLPLAIKYSATKDRNVLDLWMLLLNSWIKGNPYLKGVNWYSNIEVNIRLIVWYFCWQVLCQDEELKNDKGFISFVNDAWLPSIYEHCIYSYNNPSKYSSANNHLIAEYSGLFVAACSWNFDESARWKQYALEGLEKEIKLQHSSNGINKEEAAEYIQFITDFFLIPYAVGMKKGIAFSKEYKEHLFKIAEYISNLLEVGRNYRKYGDEDDGRVLIVSKDPHFDNFSSILSSAAVIFRSGGFKSIAKEYDLKNWLLWGSQGFDEFNKIEEQPVKRQSIFYKNEGHFFFRKVEEEDFNKEIYLHFEAAPLGFLSIAAHGHADALSVALHVDGKPIIVDVGTYTYHTDREWRKYFISTLAHNTICIDNTNQAYQAGPTMWLQHYKTEVLEVVRQGNEELVSAKHDGYKRIGCSHLRTVHFDLLKNKFIIADEIEVDNKEHHIIQPWHLHPDVEIEKLDSHAFLLKSKTGNRRVKITCDPSLNIQISNGQVDPIFGWYSNSFLKKQKTNVIAGRVKYSGTKKILLTTIIEII